MSINDEEYPLHKAVFMNDVQTLKELKDKYDLSQKDKHGWFSFLKFTCIHLNTIHCVCCCHYDSSFS